MRVDHIVVVLFVSVVVLSIVVLLGVRIKSEVVEFNVRTGEMRVNAFLLGYQYSSIDIDSNLGWINTIPVGDHDLGWIDVSSNQSGLIITRRKYIKHVGMVYIDAITLLGLTATGDKLAHGLHVIRNADPQTIWLYRDELRRRLAMNAHAPK